MMTVILVV